MLSQDCLLFLLHTTAFKTPVEAINLIMYYTYSHSQHIYIVNE